MSKSKAVTDAARIRDKVRALWRGNQTDAVLAQRLFEVDQDVRRLVETLTALEREEGKHGSSSKAEATSAR